MHTTNCTSHALLCSLAQLAEKSVMEGYFRLSPSSTSATGTLSYLRRMQQSGELCDVSLSTEDGRSVPVHKAIMAASSPFFRGMFASDLAESNQKTILLKEIDFDILQFIVSSAYNDEATLSQDRVQILLSAADLFQMKKVFDACCKFLETQIEPSSCLGLAAFADLHHCKSLNNLCTEYALNHYEEVICCDEFLSLPFDQLKQLISRDEIRVPSEEIVYNSVIQWVYHDLDTRKEMLASVMSCVRLPFVSTEFLFSNVEQEDLMLSEERCQDYIQEAVLYKSSPEKRPVLRNSPRTKPRKPCGLQDVILTVGGMGRSGPLALVEQFDANTDVWSTLTEVNNSCFGLAVCCLNGCLYTTGGSNSTDGLNNAVQCYNIGKGEWTSVKSMQHSRRYHNSEVLYGLIYSVGGQNSEGVISSVERYDPATDTWAFVQPMIEPRMYHGLAELDGYLFSVGGHNGNSRLKSVEFYDPSENLWSSVCSLSIPRSVPGVRRMGASIYVVGGFDGKDYLNSVECYDIELKKWLPCPSLGTRRSALGLVSYNGCLYACGGFNGIFLDSVERLALGTDSWEPCVSMTHGRAHFGITCT